LAQSPIEAFNHPIGLWRPGLGQAVLNPQRFEALHSKGLKKAGLNLANHSPVTGGRSVTLVVCSVG
jgi:hypothetical protein